ncbi:PQQ-binding-like beta-propeller repeat protein [Halorussus salilacus]|uniref:outer membrane protein assembly factor BamB family protein n=1 Tax=Halorussus salilacus TaxID=2953750 RepID=UPI00209C8CE5|nr:PQQ-binding-like beta-propeller repeat protein [Halorussus salilacus]USZ66666.1 PQQ-binding-like beta-propeller repeat protein [Halorussus salilacus]
MTPHPSRRRFLSLASLATAGIGALAGCGYRPGGGDVRWEGGIGTGSYLPDDVLAGADGETVFTVSRSSRDFDWETEEWGQYADLAARDAATGGVRGESQTEPVGAVAVGDGTLYVGHEDGGLSAFAADGEVGWRVETDDVIRELAASGDRVYAATDGGELVAFAADDGDPLWNTELEVSERGVALVASGDGAFAHREDTATSTAVTAFGSDGRERWHATLADDGVGNDPPVAGSDALYVPTRGKLFAVGLGDGEERWSRELDRRRGRPAVTDGAVVSADDETLYAFDPGDGEERWRFRPEGRWPDVTPPGAAEGVVCVGGSDDLHALDAADGSARWRAESEPVEGEPVVVGETVVVATDDGHFRGHWRE